MTSYKTIPKGDEDLLKEAVALHGPIAVGIDASSYRFHLYKKGGDRASQRSSDLTTGV